MAEAGQEEGWQGGATGGEIWRGGGGGSRRKWGGWGR